MRMMKDTKIRQYYYLLYRYLKIHSFLKCKEIERGVNLKKNYVIKNNEF